MAIKDLTKIKKHLFLCNGQSCKTSGAEESTAALRAAIAEAGLSEVVHTTKTLCNGRCKDGPIVISQPDGLWFKNMTTDQAAKFVEDFLLLNYINPDKVLYQYGDEKIYV